MYIECGCLIRNLSALELIGYVFVVFLLPVSIVKEFLDIITRVVLYSLIIIVQYCGYL